MTAKILDGKNYAKTRLNEIKAVFTDNGKTEIQPELAIIVTSDDPASAVYVRNKVRMATEVGINAQVYHIPDGSLAKVVGMIDVLNRSKYVNGIIVQLPLHDDLVSHKQYILDKIDPEKDVDGLSSASIAGLETGEDVFVPCTPSGIVHMLMNHHIGLSEKHVVIVGRSNLVGLPLAKLCLSYDATVTVCHSLTQNLAEITRQADILISATGQPKLITADMVKPNAVVVDVGISRDKNGRLCGDVDFESVKEVASWITPVPGGVGPVTVMTLMKHVFIAYHEQHLQK